MKRKEAKPRVEQVGKDEGKGAVDDVPAGPLPAAGILIAFDRIREREPIFLAETAKGQDVGDERVPRPCGIREEVFFPEGSAAAKRKSGRSKDQAVVIDVDFDRGAFDPVIALKDGIPGRLKRRLDRAGADLAVPIVHLFQPDAGVLLDEAAKEVELAEEVASPFLPPDEDGESRIHPFPSPAGDEGLRGSATIPEEERASPETSRLVEEGDAFESLLAQREPILFLEKRAKSLKVTRVKKDVGLA